MKKLATVYGAMSVEHRKYLNALLAVVVLFSLTPLSAHAAGMPWESFTHTLACELSGPWVKWLAVISVALGGIMFGLGELSGPFSKVMQIAGGFSIAVGAASVVPLMLGTGAIGSC